MIISIEKNHDSFITLKIEDNQYTVSTTIHNKEEAIDIVNSLADVISGLVDFIDNQDEN